jgi:urea transport system ATP-binding protein
MLLVQKRQLLLLDEPVAGMSEHETEKTAALIRAIVGERTVIVVEHDMAFVRKLGAKTTVSTKAGCSPKARSRRSSRTRG